MGACTCMRPCTCIIHIHVYTCSYRPIHMPYIGLHFTFDMVHFLIDLLVCPLADLVVYWRRDDTKTLTTPKNVSPMDTNPPCVRDTASCYLCQSSVGNSHIHRPNGHSSVYGLEKEMFSLLYTLS